MKTQQKSLKNNRIIPTPLPQELADFEEDWLQQDDISEFRGIILDEEF